MRPKFYSLVSALIYISGFGLCGCQATINPQNAPTRIEAVKTARLKDINEQLSAKDLKLGSEVFIRIYKQTSEFELWVKSGDELKLFKNYPICKYSGFLGPKLKEGDKQSPEGVYKIGKSQLNPNSSYHLSFNLGFPNEYDVFYGRTGSYLMVHGACGSVGCYAMTDPLIEEIYIILEAALLKGQEFVPVLAMPFRNTKENQPLFSDEKWGDFWRELTLIDEQFESKKKFPNIEIKEGHYVIAK